MSAVVLDMLLPTAGDTELLGAALARSLPRPLSLGAVLYLKGELGAGKTTCVRSLLRSLGISRTVRSPTYTLVETYRADAITCVHVDLYRLGGEGEAEGLGLRDLAGPDSLFLVEWPEKGGAAVPRSDVELRLDYRGEGRFAHIAAGSGTGTDWIANLGGDASLSPYVFNIT
jgi:tRNA threonylcarbamoyladenosine biosynthesis protein TsaE